MSRQPPRSAVMMSRPPPYDARASRCRAGTARRPLASSTSSETPRKTTGRPAPLPVPSARSPFVPTATRPPPPSEVSAHEPTRREDSLSRHIGPLSPTFYHFGELYVHPLAPVNVFSAPEQRLTRKMQQRYFA